MCDKDTTYDFTDDLPVAALNPPGKPDTGHHPLVGGDDTSDNNACFLCALLYALFYALLNKAQTDPNDRL